MIDHFPIPTLDALRQEFNEAGLNKTNHFMNNQELFPKDQFMMITLDILEKFCKQIQIKRIPPFFIIYTYRNCHYKDDIIKFCWRYEYSMEIHSKIYKEAMLFKYIFNMIDCIEVAKFYLNARKIIIQFFYSDYIHKYHDIELLDLQLEHWIVLINKIFNDKTSLQISQIIENLNHNFTNDGTERQDRKPKSFNAAYFLELCVIEYLKLIGQIDNNKKINKSQSPSRLNIFGTKTNTIKNQQIQTKSKTPTSRFDSSLTDSQTSNGIISKTIEIQKSPYSNNKRESGLTPSNNREKHSPLNFSNSYLNKSAILSPDKKSFDTSISQNRNSSLEISKTSISGSPLRLNNDDDDRRSETPNKLKKQIKYLKGEIYTQTKTKKKVMLENSIKNNKYLSISKLQNDMETIGTGFVELSIKHDELVDFTTELQINFLHLINQLKQKNSSILNDTKVKEAINKAISYSDYQKNYHEKLIGLNFPGAPNDFTNFLVKAMNKRFKE